METLGNRLLKPSFSKETEVGIDMQFLDRFYFSTNYSIANNTDKILKVPITPLSGAAFHWQNAGTIQTREIGRASCRERVCQSVEISVAAVSVHKKTQIRKDI